MNYRELREWVTDPSRTDSEVLEAATALGTNTTGTPAQIRDRLLVRIDSRDPDEDSGWTPTGWVAPTPPTPPAVPPAAPAPTPVAAPAAPTAAAVPAVAWYQRPWVLRTLGVAAIAVVVIGAALLLWQPWDGSMDVSDGSGPAQASSSSTPAATASAPAANLTEEQIREIATDVVDKAMADNPALTVAEAQQMIEKAVADVMAEIKKAVNITEEQVRAIVADVLRSTAAGNNGSNSCKGDKISTANEVGSAGPQRQELGGGGYQLVDFYPTKGVKAVTYIVPPLKKGGTTYEAASIGMGYGSIWEYNDSSCAQYDFVPEALSYSQGRLGNGHTGLTIDLRGGAKLVGNAGNMSQTDIEKILQQDAAAIQGWNLDAKALAAQVSSISSTRTMSGNGQSATTPSGDCKATQTPHSPTLGQAWIIPGSGPRIANVWSNATSDQQERKLKIAAGENPSIPSGGGTVWEYPAGCESTVDKEFASNPLPSYR